MSECFPQPKSSGGRVKVDTSKFAKKADFASLKFNVDKLDIDKLKNLASSSRNLKSKVDYLDVDKLVPVPVDLRKLSDVVKNDVVKKDVHNTKIKNIEDKLIDITKLVTNTTPNSKIYEVKNKIPNITHLATTSALTAVQEKLMLII